jgi:hypothetical protein
MQRPDVGVLPLARGAGLFRSTVCRSLAALLVTGSLVACGPDPAPTTSPTPSPVASQTPTETAQERQQRIDYEAAEKAYRTFRAEFNRVLQAGGSKSATRVMKRTAGGEYLKTAEGVVQAYKGFGDHQEGTEHIVYVRGGGYSTKSLILESCEDTRQVEALDKKGRSLGPGELRALKLEARATASGWKIWAGTGKKVASCEQNS